MKAQKVQIGQAAKEIGCSVSFLRERMREGDWDLGYCKDRRKEGGKSVFLVFRNKLDKFLEVGNETT